MPKKTKDKKAKVASKKFILNPKKLIQAKKINEGFCKKILEYQEIFFTIYE